MGQSRGTWHTRRAAVTASVAVVLASLALVVPSGDEAPSDLMRVAVLVVLGVLTLYAVAGFGLQLAGFDGEAPEIAGRLASDSDQQRLLARWVGRARWARFVGGFSGVLVWFLGTSGRGDLLLLGTGGIAAGAVVAEMHHMRRANGPRTARLEVRSIGDYLSTPDRRRMVGVATAAAAIAMLGVWSADTRAATWWGVAAVASLGVVRLAQRRVATRGRPAVSDMLTRADDFTRKLAIGAGLARPATYFALALVARACFALEPTLGGLGPALGTAAWLSALFLWWRNRRLGLDVLVAEQRDPLLA